MAIGRRGVMPARCPRRVLVIGAGHNVEGKAIRLSAELDGVPPC
jgi:hypothetical protein